MAKVELTLRMLNQVSSESKKIAADLDQLKSKGKELEKVLGLKGLQSKLANNYMKSVIQDIRKANGELEKKPTSNWIPGAVAAGEIIKDAFYKSMRMLYDGVKSAMDYVGKGEQTELGLKYQAPYGRNYIKQDIGAYAGITGMGQEGLKQQIIPLLRNFTDSQARQVREAASDLSVMLGHGTEDIPEFLEAFSRIQQREGLQARQLQRLGIKEKDFFTLLGKSLGVTEETARKLAKNGKYADAVRNTLLTYVANKNKDVSGKFKTGVATEEYSKTFAGRMEKLKSLPEDFLASLQGTDALKKVNDELGKIYNWVMKNKELIAGAFLKVLTKVGEVLPIIFSEKNINKWTGYLDKAAGIVSFLLDHFNTIYSIIQGIGVALFTIKAIGAIETMAKLLPGIGTTLGASWKVFQAIGAVLSTTVLGPILAITAATVSWAIAIYRIYKTVKELGGLTRVFQDVDDFIHGRSAGVSGQGVANDKINANSPQWKIEKAMAAIQGQSVSAPNISSPDIGAPTASPIKANSSFAPEVNINISGADMGDSEHTAQLISQQVNDHLSRLNEQSLIEGGGR